MQLNMYDQITIPNVNDKQTKQKKKSKVKQKQDICIIGAKICLKNSKKIIAT